MPLTFPANRELGHYQWLVRMKGNTLPQLWKHQHLLYFSCYLWPRTYNWSHSWDRNHMHKETLFNPLLTRHSWALPACANVRAINGSLIRKCHLIGKRLMTNRIFLMMVQEEVLHFCGRKAAICPKCLIQLLKYLICTVCSYTSFSLALGFHSGFHLLRRGLYAMEI